MPEGFGTFVPSSSPMCAFSNRITRLFGIDYPIIQAGMVWASGWRLASAVSNAGGLGLIGSGSMDTNVLKEHIRRCQSATKRPFGVNVPLLHAVAEQHIRLLVEEGVKIIFTSAGNPATWTNVLKQHEITVVHVVSSSRFAEKAQDAGCDAVVAEGFEAGGHNGREETSTFVLVPAVRRAVKIPILAAGGIATGRQMLAAMVLGAEGVQMGSRFVASIEASSHVSFKERVTSLKEGDTMLAAKKLTPVRLIKNEYFRELEAAENRGASAEELKTLLGRDRSKRGMFEGDLKEGELEIGQTSILIDDILPAADIVKNTWKEFTEALAEPCDYP
jgi:enoyl-[acyl-carrier protein] reductase II